MSTNQWGINEEFLNQTKLSRGIYAGYIDYSGNYNNLSFMAGMAPFLYRRHHEVYVVGDPSLKPEYLTNAELSYQTRVGHLTHLI